MSAPLKRKWFPVYGANVAAAATLAAGHDGGIGFH
jgi:hypothetical protein